MFGRLRQEHISLHRLPVQVKEGRQVIARKEILQNQKLLPECTGRLFHVVRRRRHGMVPSVYFHGLAHIVADADVVHNQAILFSRVSPVDAADGLDQHVRFQRLVIVHVGERGNIIAGDPHVNNYGDTEI